VPGAPSADVKIALKNRWARVQNHKISREIHKIIRETLENIRDWCHSCDTLMTDNIMLVNIKSEFWELVPDLHLSLHKCSKVLSTVPLHRQFARARTFENLYPEGSPHSPTPQSHQHCCHRFSDRQRPGSRPLRRHEIMTFEKICLPP